MSTDPDRHPLDDEIEATLEANPGLLERIRDARRRYLRGDLALVDHEEVRRRLLRLGVPLETEPGDGHAHRVT